MIICANCAKWLRQIQRYNNSRPLHDHENGCHPTALTQGSKRDTIPPYKFLDLALTFLRDGFKTQPPVDRRFRPVPPGFYCSKQWQPARTGGSRRSTGGWVLKPPLIGKLFRMFAIPLDTRCENVYVASAECRSCSPANHIGSCM